MTHADHLKIHRLPAQLDLVERRLAQLETVPRLERRKYWHARHAAAVAKRSRLIARAAAFGLRDLAAKGEVHV
ncbi:MAG: hypothetical protein AB7E60_14345 [Sphingobium sp.]